MLQIHVLSGTQAGQRYRIGQFPSIIGRSSSAGIRMEEPGIWEKHLSIDLDSSGAFIVKIFPGALTSLNGRSIETAFLRNGDVIEIGSAQLRVWLSETAQKTLAFREWLTWMGIALVTITEVGLVCWLLQ